jgi:hypothetical protein
MRPGKELEATRVRLGDGATLKSMKEPTKASNIGRTQNSLGFFPDSRQYRAKKRM